MAWLYFGFGVAGTDVYGYGAGTHGEAGETSRRATMPTGWPEGLCERPYPVRSWHLA